MKPAGDRHALRGRSILACPYLWATALLHAALIGVLLITLKEWPMWAWEHESVPSVVSSLIGFVNVWAAHVGMLAWLVGIGAYLLIQMRWGLGKCLVYGAVTTILWAVLIAVSLVGAASRIEEDLFFRPLRYY